MAKDRRNPTSFSQLNLREKILLSLLSVGALVENILDDLYQPMTTSFTLSSLEHQDFIKERHRSAMGTFTYLLSKNYIKTLGGAKERELQLTAEGLEYLFRKLPRLKYQRQPWDGYWRVVFYDIEEPNRRLRDKLRRELKYLGFKFMQKSVWLTPLLIDADLEKFLKEEGLWGKILVLKSRLTDEENKRLMKLFRLSAPIVKSKTVSPLAKSVERLLQTSPLPQGV